ncbi:MAG: tetratricopeptide repeat protein, partial [Kangiellaceae bacterium]|nr:tetratricopeptide repeat protein [Kangiellaceae bacterium]
YVTAIVNERLGLVLQDMNNYEKAKEHYDEVFRIHKEIASGKRVVARSYHFPAKLALLQSDFGLAEEYYAKALASLPQGSLHRSIAQLGFSQLLVEKVSIEKTSIANHVLDEAETLVVSALPILENSLPKSHSLIAEAKLTLGLIFLLSGKEEIGESLIEPAQANLSNKPVYQFGHRKLLLTKLDKVRSKHVSLKHSQ